jgi:2-polyprenyl-3-methyl-5-hydroxy-6-metoxy-1,4-benzoquinol methylase
VIVAAEYLTRVVPINTHHYEKFIAPENLKNMCSNANLGIYVYYGRCN